MLRTCEYRASARFGVVRRVLMALSPFFERNYLFQLVTARQVTCRTRTADQVDSVREQTVPCVLKINVVCIDNAE